MTHKCQCHILYVKLVNLPVITLVDEAVADCLVEVINRQAVFRGFVLENVDGLEKFPDWVSQDYSWGLLDNDTLCVLFPETFARLP